MKLHSHSWGKKNKCFSIFLVNIFHDDDGPFFKKAEILVAFKLQGQQGLSGLFEMALTGRKKVAKSKLMVASNSQQRHIFRHMVSFYVPIKSWPQ